MMRFVVPVAGSRGDVQPVLAICLELRRRGHDILLLIAPEWLGMAASLGLTARALYSDSFQEELTSQEVKDVLATGNALRIMLVHLRILRAALREAVHGIVEFAKEPEFQGADAVITTSLTEEIGHSLAEAGRVRLIALHPYPNRVNSSFPSMLASKSRLPGWGNRLSWAVFNGLRHIALNALMVTKLRRGLGLKPARLTTIAGRLRRDDVVEVQIYESELVPGIAEEWRDKPRPFTGYPKFDESARVALGEWGGPVDEVVAWMRAGSAPFFFGFGSTPMPAHTNADIVDIVARVCDRLDVRALINFGHGALPETPANGRVRVVGPIAHDRIFPFCAGAVIGGGVGTTTEVLRSGLPVLICGVAYDQPTWGIQAQKLGVGTAIRSVDIAVDSLIGAIEVLRDPAVVAKAAELGATLRGKEPPTARAATAIEAAAARARTSAR